MRNNSSARNALQRHDVAELQPPFRQCAGLVEGEGGDAARRSSAAAALDEDAGAARRPSAAMIAAGVARIKAHGQATTSTDRAG